MLGGLVMNQSITDTTTGQRRFWQENNPCGNELPSIQNEPILDNESLPPLVEGLNNGVIWIPLEDMDSAKEKEFLVNNIKDIL